MRVFVSGEANCSRDGKNGSAEEPKVPVEALLCRCREPAVIVIPNVVVADLAGDCDDV